jgi:hypothetical protein
MLIPTLYQQQHLQLPIYFLNHFPIYLIHFQPSI